MHWRQLSNLIGYVTDVMPTTKTKASKAKKKDERCWLTRAGLDWIDAMRRMTLVEDGKHR